MEPLIIECSLNEQVTKAQNAQVPIAPDEIVAAGLEAAEAGAAILHFHARDQETGDLMHPGTEFYREVMAGIRSSNPEVILYPTYGSSPTPAERFSHVEALAQDADIRLDCATIDPGALNYADYDRGARELGWDFVLTVSHEEARYFFDLCRQYQIAYSFTVREAGHVRHALVYRDMGWVDDPLFFKIVMSENHAWGLPPSIEGLRMLTELIIPDDVPYRWMTYVDGASHVAMSRHAVESGGHVRTGIGDNPLFDGQALSNAEQVDQIVQMARRIGREVAGPAEARALFASDPG